MSKKCIGDCKSCDVDFCINRRETYVKPEFDLSQLKPKESHAINMMFKWFQITFYSLFILSSISFGGLIVYWINEPDPLTVSYVQDDRTWSKCEERKYSFTRFVKTTKDVDIHVQERYYDMDRMNDSGHIEGEIVYPDDVQYQLGQGFEKIMTFRKHVPSDLSYGRYEYRPWARYRVNPMKEIFRPLPTQKVEVTCEYNPLKHGAMK